MSPIHGEEKEEVRIESIFCQRTGSSLANYPQATKVGNFLFLSGVSARQPDNSIVGAKKLSSGAYVKSIALQTAGVIEK